MTQLWANYVIPAYKLADSSVTSSTLLVNDPQLICHVDADRTYLIKAVLIMNDINSGMKIGLGGTSTANALAAVVRIYDANGLHKTGLLTGYGQSIEHNKKNSGFHYIEIEGSVQINTAGTLLLQWAQQTSDPGALDLLKMSYMTLEKYHT